MLLQPTRRSRNRIACVGLLVPLCAWIGCADRNRLALSQPHAPPSQRQIELASEWGYCAPQDARHLVLLDFPLPGASDGPRDFRVFLALPTARGTISIGAGTDQGHGFLIQGVGSLRGKTEFVSGTVKLSDPLIRSRRTKVVLDVACKDGTRVSGKATVLESDNELKQFLRKHAADVAALDSAATPARLASDTPATPTRAGNADSAVADESRPVTTQPAARGTE